MQLGRSNMNKHLNALMSRFEYEGLTFDDVSLVTQYADFLPEDADLSSRLTRRVTLNIPFLSAAMDTVTESRMAIAMAMLGGIGIVHKNLSIRAQARCVAEVKHHLHGVIRSPVCFHSNQTLQQILDEKTQQAYSFSGFPILDNDDNLAGILTSADMKFVGDTAAPVAEFMTKDVIVGPPETSHDEAYAIMRREKIGKLPLVHEGKLVGLYSYSDVRTLVENVQPMYNRDDKYRLRVGAAIGPGDFERIELLASEEIDVVIIDTAHGHTQAVIDTVKWIKERFDAIDVVAGNIGTAEAALALRDAGADAVKVGIGPGSICTTRVVCGVGVPQFTAVYNCTQALDGSIPVIADGGVRHSGDVPKAIVAGADSVMMGSVLAGTDEGPGEKIIQQGRQYVVYRGMGSLAAMREAIGSRERYQQHDVDEDDLVPQGVEGLVPYAGSVHSVMNQFIGGLRSALGYSGCRSIDELHSNGRVVRISLAGLKEAHPHDVRITREAPNYRS